MTHPTQDPPIVQGPRWPKGTYSWQVADAAAALVDHRAIQHPARIEGRPR